MDKTLNFSLAPRGILDQFLTVAQIIALIALPFLAFSQNDDKLQKVDSLEQILHEYKAFDTFRVDLLNRIGYEYWIMDPSVSEQKGIEALEISKVLPYREGEAFACRIVGVSHWARGNLELAFKFLLDAERNYVALDDSLGIANSTLNLGMTYAARQDLGIAKTKYDKALEIFIELNQESRIATTYTKMGDLYTEQDEFDKAYSYLTDALTIYQKQNFLYGIAEVNGKLGEMFIKKEEYTKSLSHTLMAIEASSKRIDHVGLGKYHYNLGIAHELKGESTLAVENFETSLGYAERFNLKNVQQDLYLKFKEIEERRGNYRLALDFYKKYNTTKNEIFNLELANTISNLDAQHSYQQRQKELELAQRNLDLLKEKNKSSRSFSMLLVLALISLASIGWGLLGRQSRKLYSQSQDLAKVSEKASNLSDEIKLKEQEMASYTLNFVQKNEAITELKNAIQEIKTSLKREDKSKVSILEKKINNILRVDEDWSDFSKHFENVHPTLIQNLRSKFPNLTKNEYKLISLIRLNLTSKEISSVVGISPDSVKTARYRLRKKLLLPSQEDLFNFLVRFETNPLQKVS